jgi:hypothetical protein
MLSLRNEREPHQKMEACLNDPGNPYIWHHSRMISQILSKTLRMEMCGLAEVLEE